MVLGPYVYDPFAYPYNLPPYNTPSYYPQPYTLGSGNFQPSNNNINNLPRDSEIEKAAAERGTNAQSVARGWKFIGYGDALFQKQKYREALDRYRMASASAPQLGDAFLRQGFAYAATGRYDLAVKAFQRGLAIDPKLPQSDFKLGDLYGDDDVKTGHLETLAKSAEDNPANVAQLFILGVYLHFDRQQDRAKPFFRRAADQAGGEVDAINAFLRE